MHRIAERGQPSVGTIDHESRQQSCRLSAVQDGGDDDPDRRLVGEGMNRPDRDRTETGLETGQHLRQRLHRVNERQMPLGLEQAPGSPQPWFQGPLGHMGRLAIRNRRSLAPARRVEGWVHRDRII